jgi:hypothetical protein
MLDIVATHQHQPPLVVDDCRIGHGKARRPASRRFKSPRAGDLAKEPERGNQDGGEAKKDLDLFKFRVLPAKERLKECHARLSLPQGEAARQTAIPPLTSFDPK